MESLTGAAIRNVVGITILENKIRRLERLMFDAKDKLLAPLPEAETSPEPLTTEDLGDLELATRAGRGDEYAYVLLFEKYRSKTQRLCARIVDAADSEDLNQEVWIQVFRKITSFRGESAFSTWVHRLTVNQCLMHLRKRSVKYERVMDDEEEFLPVAETWLVKNRPNFSVLDKIALDEAMEGMPEGYRNVFYYHDVLGFEHEEVAAIVGCSVGTSKSQLHKARMKLAGLLQMRKWSPYSESFLGKRYVAKLGIELPAMSRMELEQSIELVIEAEEDDYADEWSEEEV
jgi:RNA polymerase sigma-70 factor, ECF subfamily